LSEELEVLEVISTFSPQNPFTGSWIKETKEKGLLPKAIPVRTFHKPEKTNVVESEIELFTASAIINGRRVPRSPKEPDISAKGDLRRVETLLVWSWRIEPVLGMVGSVRGWASKERNCWIAARHTKNGIFTAFLNKRERGGASRPCRVRRVQAPRPSLLHFSIQEPQT